MRKPILVGVAVIAFFVSIPSTKKLWDTVKQHHLTKEAVDFLRENLANVPDDQLVIRMSPPCLEASDAMSVYIGRHKLIKMLTPKDIFFTQTSHRRRLLILNGECAEIPSGFVLKKEIFRMDPWVVLEGK